MCGPTPLVLILMLLLNRVAGNISSNNKDEEPSSLTKAEKYSAFSTPAFYAESASDDLQSSLRFEPPHLDFGAACPVGTARAHTVTLVNQNENRSVYLTSVSGRTPTFYSSFFETKVVPPRGNTTFNVVFLPRAHGSVATDLLIHTSFGQARLKVRGEGSDCPYRLKPLVGIRAPLNATLTPEIQMYNPHSKPLQILEVYSSGGQFQLELPSGVQEGPQTLWEIPPYETKSVIRIRFHARTVGNHTAYIRIKISEQANNSASDKEENHGNVLVIPVEFEILPKHGLYAQNPVVNFGHFSTAASADGIKDGNIKPLQIKLQLHSSHTRLRHKLLDFTLRKIPGLTFDPKEGVVSLETDLFNSTTILDEVMILRSTPYTPHHDSFSNVPHEFTVLIRAKVFKGRLYYDSNSTNFVTQATLGTRGGNKRILIVRNDYEIPLALLNVSLPQYDENNRALRAEFSSDYLKVVNVTGFLVLPPGGSLALLQLQMLNSSMTYKTTLLIRTNITHIEVPLVVCSGRLHVSTYDTARIQADASYSVDLNLGTIPLAETSHCGYIVLHNRNPLSIKLNNWHFETPQGVYFSTSFRGCLRLASLRALRNDTLKIDSAKLKLCTHMEEGDVAVFQVTIQSYITEQHQCTLKIWTAYEEILTTVRFRTWIGKLEVDQEKLYFSHCFPGKHCSAELAIRSTFQHPIYITSINFTDSGLKFEDYNVNGSMIKGNATTTVGRIHFEPSLFCQQRCYIPRDGHSNAIAFPIPENTAGGPNNNLHFDETELRRRTDLFRLLKTDFQNIAFILNSNEVRQFLLQLIIDIEWPKFVVKKPILPSIEVGNPYEIQVILSNPAGTPVLLDYFLADPAFAKETEMTLPLEVVDHVPNCYLTDQEVFSLPNGAPSQPVLLQPHTSMPVTIRLHATVADTYCTLLHIRNNLTLYEGLWVSGKVVQSEFRLGNRKPGSNESLTFNLTEKHLSSCNPSLKQHHSPNSNNMVENRKYPKVMLKRKFTARNTGEIPIWIESFQIGNKICSGYGFKVLDCNSFALKANESKKIEILYTPDYTMHRITLPFKIHSNLSYDIEYTLQAQLPLEMVEECSVLITRPEWEERIGNAAIVLLASTFIFVLIAAHIDYDNILRIQTVLFEARDKGSVHPTFNLRNIALKAQIAAHANDDEYQHDTSVHTTTSRCSGSQQQYPKGSNSSSCSSSGSNSSGGNNTSCMKKRSLKRQNNANGNVTSNRVSLPWSLDLNAFKSCASSTKPPNDKVNVNSGAIDTHSTGNESSGKKNAAGSVLQKSHAHNDKVDRGNSSSNNSRKQHHNTGHASTTQLQAPTSPPQQQQSRSSRKAKNTAAGPITPAEKPEREAASTANQKSQTNNSSSSKHTRGNVSKSSSGDTNNLVKGNSVDVAVPCSPLISTLSPPTKEIAAQSALSGVKYGKTPGRERRKESQNSSSANIANDGSLPSSSANSGGSSSASRRAERRSRQRAATALRALNFGDTSAVAATTASIRTRPTSGNDNSGSGGSGMGGLLSCLSSPWDTGSQATFSDVLQAQPVSAVAKNALKVNDQSSMAVGESRSSLFYTEKEKTSPEQESDIGGKPLQQQSQVYGQHQGDLALEKMCSINSTELGPIGSKKSPSSTPVWEPVNSSSSGSSNHSGNGLQIPKPIVSTGDCSFFSNLDYEGSQQHHGGDASLFAMKKAQNEYFEYMYTLRQQQLQAQVQAHAQAQVQAQQQQQQQQLMQGVDWARVNSRTWSPMAAYLGQHDNSGLSGSVLATTVDSVSSASLLMSNLGASVAGASNATSSAWPIATTSGTSANGSGNASSTIVRPPPGLESSFQGISNNTQPIAKQQQQQSLNVSSNDGNGSITGDMQTFDPFSSLSSIWSDSWQKRNNSNNSNKNNGT
ncbi:transmembrane protein 131 homolog [Ceratitis capitata]|uniref:transmembrane protein 131 homolog n=1 Tax=Ceratitis capitata TaxID=7213 RepID=UPI0003297990|nr:transmembrane protein 131 homolog [Ceratitis capitata]